MTATSIYFVYFFYFGIASVIPIRNMTKQPIRLDGNL